MSEMVDLRSCHISKIIFSLTMSTECKNEQYIKNAGKEQCCRWKLSSQVSPLGRTCSWPHCAVEQFLNTSVLYPHFIQSLFLHQGWRSGSLWVLEVPRMSTCISGRTVSFCGWICFLSKLRETTYSFTGKQIKWEKLEVRKELSKSSLIDVLANESRCNFSIEIIHQRSSD